MLSKYQVEFSLDFDDAFQYYLSKSKNLKLISYDKDFDKTPERRITPYEIMNNRSLTT